MIQLSATSIKAYVDCPAKFNYRNLLRGEDGKPTEDTFVGLLVHDTLEKFWYDKSKALKYIEKKLKTVDVSDNGINKIGKCLDNFFIHFQHMLTIKDSIELDFKIKFNSKVNLVGRIDRIINSVVLLDWKTSTKPPRNINKDIQFILYNYAYKKLYGKSPSAVCLASLSTGDLIEYKHDPKFEAVLLDQLIPEIVSNIYSTKPYVKSGVFNNKCYRCQFKDMCWSEEEWYVMDN